LKRQKRQALGLSGSLVAEAVDHAVDEVSHGGAEVAHFAAAGEVAGAVMDGGAGFVVVADAGQLHGQIKLPQSLSQSG
jgi:hypothetical protein